VQILDSTDHERVRPLFSDLIRYNVSIDGVLTGNNPGAVYVDHPQAPQVALLMSPESAYLAGAASSAQASAVTSQIVALMESDDNEALWLVCDPTWQPDLLPRRALPIPRQHYDCTAVSFDWRSRVPEGFAVYAIDEAFFDRSALAIPDHLDDWMLSCWGSQEHFLAHGFGFVTVALNTNQVVSWSLCDCIGNNACEIGIHTHPDYRQRGLAALTTAATVDHALVGGLSLVGWHCDADNIASQRTALRVGFTFERDYAAFVYFRQEAVYWAEAGRLQEVAGDYRAAAAHYIRADACEDKPTWGQNLPFYAACAFARLGDYASAWLWLDRAVAQGFDDTNALQSVDALTPMKNTAAWDNLLQAMG
jgi:RimJ/RimL family protein N-acetyltransferase